MGFFDLKAICGCCGKECGLNRFKIKKSNAWLCPECLKKAGGPMKIDISKITIEEIKDIISEKEDEINLRRESSSTGLATAEEMYAYAKENGFGSGMNESWGVKHFKIIEENLLTGEDVLMTFIGLHNYVSATKHDNNFAYAITNKRFIMAQKLLVGQNLQTVYLDSINDVTFKAGVVFGILTIDTLKEIFNVGLDKISAQKISNEVHKVLDNLKHSAENVVSSEPVRSEADEIIKFKNLLDQGIITQEEFDQKKKQLLGL